MNDVYWKVATWMFKGLMGFCIALIAGIGGILILLVVIGLLLPDPEKSAAQNIYMPGTHGSALAEFAKTVLPPSVTPYFVMSKDRRYFLDQADQTKLGKKISVTALERLQVLPQFHRRVAAFVDFDKHTREGSERRVCRIVFVDQALAQDESTVMHELMHCRIGSAELEGGYQQQIMKAVSFAPDIRPGPTLTMFEEILTRAMSLSYIVNYGVMADANFFRNRINKGYPVNPGVHSMPRVIQICIVKNKCSIDAEELAKTLLSDQEFVRLLKLDYAENHAHNLAVGFH